MSGTFEDLESWHAARQLTQQVYAITDTGTFARDFGLRDQIRRAAVSIMSNIAEGYERFNPAEQHQFYVIAKGSCAEVRAQLFVALDVGHISADDFARLQAQAATVGRLVGGLRKWAQRKREG